VKAATVIYDGDCGFCTAAVGVASRRLSAPVETVPMRRADLAGLGIPESDARRALQWIGPSGEREEGHRAVAAWLRSSGGVWRTVGSLLTAPGLDRLSGLAYRVVASNRRRIPGPWARTCAVTPPDDSR
jgi:predicted DCC family thiol-disulfide oxidoreductase YuxK